MPRRNLAIPKPRKHFTLQMHEQMMRAALRPPRTPLPVVSPALKSQFKSRLPKVK